MNTIYSISDERIRHTPGEENGTYKSVDWPRRVRGHTDPEDAVVPEQLRVCNL